MATNARSVTVGGGVKAPQRLPWSPDLTLKTAIDLCGGLDDFSNGKNVRLIRGGKVQGTFNYKKMSWSDVPATESEMAIAPPLVPADDAGQTEVLAPVY